MIHTKLHRPPSTNDHVNRERLFVKLNENKHKPFTLVSAPVGYGKSMLISSWLEYCDCDSVWISLNSNDNELRSILNSVFVGVNQVIPKPKNKMDSNSSGNW